MAERTILQEFGIHLTDKSVSAQGQTVPLDEIKEVNVASEKRTSFLWILFMLASPVAIGWIGWTRYKYWNENTTVQNLALIEVRDDEGLLLVRGAVPGGKNGMVIVKNAVKRTGAVRLASDGEETKAKKGAAKKPAAAAKKK